MKKLILFVFAFALLLSPCACHAGPFGLEAGMSRDDVVQKIGKNAVVKEYPDSIFFNAVPAPSEYFDEYQCSFDKSNKLVSITASSRALLTRSGGEDLRESFDRLVSALEDKYGKVLFIEGSRASGVKWLDCIGYRRPFTAATWDGSSEPGRSSHINQIVLEVEAADKDHGFIELKYNFNSALDAPL